MLEGKLVEAGREPRNVQVVLSEEEDTPTIRLEDGEGVFVEIPCVAGGVERGYAVGIGGADGDSDGSGSSGAREDEKTDTGVAELEHRARVGRVGGGVTQSRRTDGGVKEGGERSTRTRERAVSE